MNVREYKSKHEYCELADHFPVAHRLKIVGTTGFPLFGGHCRIDASQLHHIVGQTSKGRTDDERNVLHLNIYVHEWVTDHPCAGRILSAWELKRKGMLDWAFLSDLDGKCWPGLFENGFYLADVERFPWIAPYHAQLIRDAVRDGSGSAGTPGTEDCVMDFDKFWDSLCERNPGLKLTDQRMTISVESFKASLQQAHAMGAKSVPVIVPKKSGMDLDELFRGFGM